MLNMAILYNYVCYNFMCQMILTTILIFSSSIPLELIGLLIDYL